jgi:transitional endoplasmic reticulum ATPase
LINETKSGSDDFVSLKVTETNAKFVGKGMALIDPAVAEEMKPTTGDVVEITTSSGKRKTFCFVMVSSTRRLWIKNNKN